MANLRDILVPNFGFQDSDTQVGIAPVNTQAGTISFNDANRIVKNNVRINIGSSPNSNTGDPLRTAFIKVGNFMEAVYRADSDKDLRIKRFETPVGDSDFRILGVKTGNDLRWDSDAVHPNLGNATTGFDSDTFAGLKPGDTVVLVDRIDPSNRQDFVDKFSRSNPHGRIDINTVRLKNNEYSINAPAFLKVGSDGLLKVQTEFALDQVGLDFDGALERLSAGTQKSKLSSAEQKQLYKDFNDVQGLTSSSFRLSASNVEDAFAELMARQVRVGYDAGFYG